ncbi:small hydrophilic protein [Streptomyces sp. Tu 2975]|uniref:small hydrophilic protein n=1 Tax=Streptomyces sp. Tu 2975 TaxID=2676871 RepID=UPI0013571F88|nr:small hydrophilic protein [Streptomyces sp. Tu 2975]QIP86890.1 small hydrophilic protein [Streptomyces sp. Tu 2975]
MAFTHRMATLAAVVAIPLGIAATSYALTDAPETPRVPPAVELDATPRPASPAPSATPGGTPSGSPSATPAIPRPTGDAVVPGPAATDDDDDDTGEEN